MRESEKADLGGAGPKVKDLGTRPDPDLSTVEAGKIILAHSTSYHDHKETMAYAAVALQFGIVHCHYCRS